MKKIFLTTALLSVLTMPAMADVKWFVGGNIGYVEPIYSDLLEDQIDDDLWENDSGTLSLSLLGGFRFGDYNKIYNGGVTATITNMNELGHLTDGDANPYDMDATLDYTTLTFTYDNYIRLSGESKCRTDFIISIGLGYGWIEEKLSEPGYGSESFSDSGLLTSLKFGFGGETVVKGLSWSAAWTITALNADSDADLQGSSGFEFGVKYTF